MKTKVTAVLVCLAVAIAAYALWPAKNGLARKRVTQILLSDTSPAAQLAALKPYVQLGDSYLAVAAGLHPQPDTAKQGRERPKYHSLGLGGVNLELAIRTDGTIAGIGRFIYDRDTDGTVWLAGHGDKWWESLVTQSN
jgi:hypothetical protein